MKKNCKHLSVLLLIFLLVISISACTGSGGSAKTAVPSDTEPAVSSSTQVADEPTEAIITEQTPLENARLRLSTTTSVNDSGLLEELESVFEAQSGYDLEIIANGTGAAIKMGETGDADVLLVHAKAAEEEFIDGGFGIERLPFMHNFFILAGDASDPAAVTGSASAAEAFAKIADAQSTFVSRGDDSGTHKAELKIWQQLEREPGGDWYVAAGKGMGPCLTMAGEMQAYIFTDKATWLATRDQHGLEMLLGASDDMKNTYSVIAVNPDKHPGINAEGAQAWIAFLKSDEARTIIEEFGLAEFNEVLFIYDGFGE